MLSNDTKVKVILVGCLMIAAGLFGVLLPIILFLLIAFVVNMLVDNKIVSVIVAYLLSTFLSSCFELLIFYFPASEFVQQLGSGYTIISFVLLSGVFELLFNEWVLSLGIGFQWLVFGLGIIVIGAVIVYSLYSNSINS